MSAYYYDLHIHSALSPCADDDMTPNNIVNMALIKGLHVITVSDHNSADNTPAVETLARDAGITFIPGIEMTSSEEVHILAFFETAADAVQFSDILYDALPDIPNNEDFFGHQYIMNEVDEIIGKKEKLLLTALPYEFSECCRLAYNHGAVVVPAHVNKGANSVLANLGFFPPDSDFGTIEVRPECSMMGVDLTYRQLTSSDAHMLEMIAEPERTLELGECTVRGVLDLLR